MNSFDVDFLNGFSAVFNAKFLGLMAALAVPFFLWHGFVRLGRIERLLLNNRSEILVSIAMHHSAGEVCTCECPACYHFGCGREPEPNAEPEPRKLTVWQGLANSSLAWLGLPTIPVPEADYRTKGEKLSDVIVMSATCLGILIAVVFTWCSFFGFVFPVW
jgi:hypothetical protein